MWKEIMDPDCRVVEDVRSFNLMEFASMIIASNSERVWVADSAGGCFCILIPVEGHKSVHSFRETTGVGTQRYTPEVRERGKIHGGRRPVAYYLDICTMSP